MRKLMLPALVLCGVLSLHGTSRATCIFLSDGSGNVTLDGCGGGDSVTGQTATVTSGQFIIIRVPDLTVTNLGTSPDSTSSHSAVASERAGNSLINFGTISKGVFAGNGIRFDVTNESGGLITRGSFPAAQTFAVELHGGGALTNSGTIGNGLTGTDSNGKVLIITSLSSPGVLTNNLGGTIQGDVALTGDAARVVNRGSITSVTESWSTGVSFSGANPSLTNSGLIAGGKGYGVLSNDFGGANITNEAGGRIEGGGGGVIIGQGGTLTNQGTIIGTGPFGDGLFIHEQAYTVVNQEGGLIQGVGGSGIRNSTPTSDGPLPQLPGNKGNTFPNRLILTNRGAITGAQYGIRLDSGDFPGGAHSITNSGTISGGVGIRSDMNIGITNSGTITGMGGSGVLLGGGGTLTNTGTVTSQTGIAIEFTGSPAGQLTNLGTITPASGSAAVQMGSGNDTVTLQTGSAVNGNIDGGAGTDTLTLEGSGTFGHSLLNFEDIQMPGPGSWSLTGGGGLSASTITMTNGGSISGGIVAAGSSTLTLLSGGSAGAAGNGRAIDFQGGGAVTNSGTISGEVRIGGPSASFTNASGGVVNSSIGGVTLTANNATFVNHGSIASGSGNTGVSLTGANATVTNTGTITGASTGLSMASGTLTNSGSITGNGGAGLSAAGATVTNTGTITSQTGIAVDITGSAASTVTNSGTITPASGSAAIRMGSGNDTVTLNAGSVVNGNIDGGAGTDTLNVQAGVTFSHSYLNFEALNIEAAQSSSSSSGEPAAPVQLTSFSGVTAITVSSGSADLSGGTINSDVTVGASGTLVGVGMINGDVTNSGTIGPGNSIGTISINGNFTNNPTGTEQVELAPDGTSDLIQVTGTATLGGGTVNPVLLFGATPFQGGTQYPILTATGGVTGQFATLNQPYLTSSFALTYEANRVLLTLTRNPFAGFAVTSNQTAVGTYLDTLVAGATGDLAAVINTLDALTQVNDLRTAYEQFSPEPHDAYARQAFAMAGWLGSAVSGRLREARGDSSLPARAASVVAMNEVILSDAAPALFPEEKGWSGWARALGGKGGLDSASERTGFDYDTAGLMAGLDHRLSGTTVVGLGAGYARTEMDLRNGRGKGETDSYQLGLYATWHQGGFHLDLGAFYGLNQHDASRNITYPGLAREATADYDSQQVTALMGGGWLSPLGGWKVGPELSVLYSHLDQDSFTETGAGDISLKVQKRRTGSLRSTLGLLAQRVVKLEEGQFDLEARAAWAREHLDGDRDMKASFVGTSTPGSFKVKAEEPVRDAIQVGVGVGFRVSGTARLFAQYEGGFGQDGYRSHTGLLGLQVRF